MQTAKWVSPFMSIDDPFDLVVFRADAVRFVPVDFRMRYRTIRKFNRGNSLELPPAPLAVQPPEPLSLSDGGAGRNNFHLDDTTDDRELHASTPPSHLTYEQPLVLPQLPQRHHEPFRVMMLP